MTDQLRLSVVVPCRNEVKHIEGCILSILGAGQEWDGSINIYIVDGMSDDGTVEQIQILQDLYPNVHLVENHHQVTPFAFNLGIHANTERDFVLIVGSRHIISSDYIRRAVSILQENPEIWCVGGKVDNVYLNETGEIIAKAMGTSFGMGLGNFRTLNESGFVDTVGTPMYPSWVFDKIGFFDEHLVRNQDDDFNFRVHQAGGKVYYEDAIRIKYFVRGSFEGLRRQFFQYGYWKVYVNRKHRAVTTFRQLIPPLFVLYLFLIIPSFLLGSKAAFVFNLPLLMYLLMTVFFSARQAKNMSEFSQLCVTYFILHVSYGLGYLRGIVDFLILGKKPSENQKRLSR